MLYEPHTRLKKIILIGAAAIALVVLIIAVILLFKKNKPVQVPENNLSSKEKIQQEKIQEGLKKLNEVKKSENNAPEPTPADIQTELKKIDEENKKSDVPPPTQEDIQKQLDLINKMKK